MPDPNQQQATQQPSGAPPAAGQQPTAPESDKPNSKGWEAAEKYKADLEATRKELDALKSAKASQEQAEAAKRGEFEKLWKESEAKREAAEKRTAEAEAEKVRVAKRGALSLEMVKLGVLDTAFVDLADLSEVSDDGKNAPEVAKKIHAAKPNWFGTGKSGTPTPTPQANPGGSASEPLDLKKLTTREAHEDARKKDPKGYLDAMRRLATSS